MSFRDKVRRGLQRVANRIRRFIKPGQRAASPSPRFISFPRRIQRHSDPAPIPHVPEHLWETIFGLVFSATVEDAVDQILWPHRLIFEGERRVRWETFLRLGLVSRDWCRISKRVLCTSIILNHSLQVDRPAPPGPIRQAQFQGIRHAFVREPALLLYVGRLSLGLPYYSETTDNRTQLLRRFGEYRTLDRRTGLTIPFGKGQIVLACSTLSDLRLNFNRWPLGEALDLTFVTALGQKPNLRTFAISSPPDFVAFFYWLSTWNLLSTLEITLRRGQQLVPPENFVPGFRLHQFNFSAYWYAFRHTPGILSVLGHSAMTLSGLAFEVKRPETHQIDAFPIVEPLVRVMGSRLESLAIVETPTKVPGRSRPPSIEIPYWPVDGYCPRLRLLELGGVRYDSAMIRERLGGDRMEELHVVESANETAEPLLTLLEVLPRLGVVKLRLEQDWNARECSRVTKTARRKGIRLVWYE